MTEEEWLVCEDPARLLPLLKESSERKRRLCGCAAAAYLDEGAHNGSRRNAIEDLERLADSGKSLVECPWLVADRSPLVGALYRRPRPGDPLYVTVGDSVTPATIICLIEAMKLFNEISSEHDGIVIDFNSSDGDAVTEAEWLACDRLTSLAPYLSESQSDRKLRLFACACCRRIWSTLADNRSRLAVDVAELFAEGTISRGELDEVAVAAQEAIAEAKSQQDEFARTATAHAASHMRVDPHSTQVYWFRTTAGNALRAVAIEIKEWYAEEARQMELLRDIVGNPFRPVAFSSDWRTDTAVSLARRIYDTREFSALPILADALQDAGCDSDDVLNHCRGDGPHVRGCWVVDAVLGKS